MAVSITKEIAENSRILSEVIYKNYEHDFLVELVPKHLSRTQFAILKLLFNSGPCAISDIARLLQISRAAASKNTDKLVHLHYVSRKEYKEDRRSTKVSLLKVGQRIIDTYNRWNLKKQKKAMKKEVTERLRNGSTLAEVEKAHILMVYEQAERNKAQTSDVLGIGLNTLRRKLRSYGMD